MVKRRFAAACALLLGAASFPVLAAAPAGAQSAAILYVDNTSSACTDAGPGSAAAPFCTIQAAADVAVAGQTVLIGGFNTSYTEDVQVKTSGTASAPITFAAAHTYFTDAQPDHDFTLTGASNIVIDGLYGDAVGDAVVVSGSSDITIEHSTLRQGAQDPADPSAGVHVTGGSSAVAVEFNRIVTFSGIAGTGVRVDAGSSGTVVAANYLSAFGTTGIAVTGSSGTEITGNTLGSPAYMSCGTGIDIGTGATSTSVENNVVLGVSSEFSACPAPSDPVALKVAADAAPTTSAQYNVLSTDGGGTTPYAWAGASYTTAAQFQAATGQGAQDVVASRLDFSKNAIPAASPLIDSADANAPGETATDVYGNPRVDDPSIANSGTGAGYYDRGAIEYQEYTSSTLAVSLDGPQHAIAQVSLQGVPWGSSATETIDWGDGTPKDTFVDPSNDTTTDYTNWFGGQHEYAERGTYTVTETLTDNAGTKTLTGTVSTQGDTYTPVASTRVLDTRKGTGVGGSAEPVAAHGSVAVDVASGVPGAPPLADIAAVVVNVTVTAPTAGGFITAYPHGHALPLASNLNFVTGQTAAGLVTVKVGADGKIALYNGSTGTSHLVADVEGYYTATSAGSGFVPVAPQRLLDTRDGTGAGGSTEPVAGHATLDLGVAGAGPVPASGVSAVALNITVTAPAAGGYLTAYPSGGPKPATSNLNFGPGQTVANLVIVPVGANGEVSLTNASAGATHVIADVQGYYTASGGHAFVPLEPVRVLDTRTGLGQESAPTRIPAGGEQVIRVEAPVLQAARTFVVNVTVTGAETGGYITAYAEGATAPATSNLNFAPGQTVPNLALVGTPVLLHNHSHGAVDLVADAFGYFS